MTFDRVAIYVLRLAALASLAFIVGASLVPAEVRPTVGATGMVEHMLAYVACGFLFATGFSQFRSTFVWIWLALLAGCLELAQLYVPGRDARLPDAIMSAAGALMGVLAARVVILMVRAAYRDRGPQNL